MFQKIKVYYKIEKKFQLTLVISFHDIYTFHDFLIGKIYIFSLAKFFQTF